MLIFRYIVSISEFSTILAALLAFFYYSKLKGEIRILAWLVFMNLFFEIITTLTAMYRIENLILTHFYAMLGCTIIALMFAEATKSYISKKVYHYVIVFFLIFSIVNILFFNPLYTFNKFGRALESVLVIGFCFTYFFQLLDQLKVKQLYKEPFFLVVLASLLYSAGSFFASLFMFIKFEKDYFAYAYGIVVSFVLIKNMLYAIAIWLAGKQVEKKEEEYAIE